MNISRILTVAGIAIASLIFAIPAQAHGGGGHGVGFGGHVGGFGPHWGGFGDHRGDFRGHGRGFGTAFYGDGYFGGYYDYEPAYDDSLIYRDPYYGYGLSDGFTIGFAGHRWGQHGGHRHSGRR